MKAESNHNENNRRSLRRRRSEDAESLSSLRLLEQQDDLERSLQPDVECVGWEPADSQLLPLNGEPSIVTDHGLLGPTLAAAGIDFCANETDFEFQHFQYYPEDVSTNATSLDQQVQGWYVKCCDSPGQLEKSKNNSNHALDSLLENQNNESIFEIVSNSSTISPAVDPLPEILDGELDCTNNSGTGVPMQCHTSMVVGQIVVSSIAVILSLATILALTLPLFDKKKRSRASTYNLYLVFLSFPDLLYNFFLVLLFARFQHFTVKSDPTPNGEFPLIAHPYDLALFSACAAASLYTNAIIAYEILKLLRNSKRRMRSKAPTMRMATKQAACTYLIGAIIFIVDDRAGDFFKGDTLPKWAKRGIVYPIYFVMAIFAPMLYLVWVCFRIYWEKLVGDVRSKAGKRLSVLVRYFSRIIIVYVCIWLPAAILYNFQWFASYNPGMYYYQACIMYAIQVWVSFGLSLSKPDVRQNFVDFFTLRSFQFSSREESQGINKFTNSNFSNSREKTSSTADTGEKVKLDNTKNSDDENQDASERCAATEDCEESGDPEDDDVDNKNVDVDVFEFDGADAPRERTDRMIMSDRKIMFGRSLRRNHVKPERRATVYFGSERQQDSDATNARSSLTMRSQSMRMVREHKSFSEPFDLNGSASVRASDPSFSGRRSVFSDENSRRLSRLSFDFDDTNRLSTTEYTIPLDVMEEDDADILAIPETTTEGLRLSGPSQARSSGSRNSGSRDSSRQSDMYKFFMNRDSTILPSSQISSYLVSERKRSRWIRNLRKNIRDMAKMLTREDLSVEQKSIYSRSMSLKQRALSIAESIQIDTIDASGKSSISSLDSARRDRDRYRSGKISISFALEQIKEVSFANRESTVSALAADQLHDDVESYDSGDGSDDSSIMSLAESDRVSLPDRSSSASATDSLWLSELQENIRDLKRRLSVEGLSQEERALLERAIKSQHVTLKSLGGFIEAQAGDSRSSSGESIDHS